MKFLKFLSRCCPPVANRRENHNTEVFLDHKRKKTWEDAETGHKCFMLYARSLNVIWGRNPYIWRWNNFKHSSDENIEVAELLAECWLDVSGKFDVSNLSPATWYEVVFVIKLTESAIGWEVPINLKLTLPNGTVKERHVSLFQKPRKEWIKISVGSFYTEAGETREVGFDLCEHCNENWKTGFIVKGVILEKLYYGSVPPRVHETDQ